MESSTRILSPGIKRRVFAAELQANQFPPHSAEDRNCNSEPSPTQVGGPTRGPSGPTWGPSGPKPEIWDPTKIQKTKILKIKIRSAPNVGKKTSRPHLGPSRPIFCVGRKNPKNQKKIQKAYFFVHMIAIMASPKELLGSCRTLGHGSGGFSFAASFGLSWPSDDAGGPRGAHP